MRSSKKYSMLLWKVDWHKKVSASSIAEVVIALTIIALCFGVASLIFVRSTNVTTRFQDIRLQTEIQSSIFESFLKENDSIPFISKEGVETIQSTDEISDSLAVITFFGGDNRLIWKQQVHRK